MDEDYSIKGKQRMDITHKEIWVRSRNELMKTLTGLGFREDLGDAIVKNLGSPKAMDRMTVLITCRWSD